MTAAPETIAVILFAHGAKNDRWKQPIFDLADRLSEDLAPSRVTAAFLQFGEPKLPPALEALIREGATVIVILPYFLATGGHLLADLPRIIDETKAIHPHVEFFVAPPLGESPLVIDAFRRASREFVDSVAPRRE